MRRKLNGSTTAAIGMFLISGVLASVLGVRQYERVTTHEVLGIVGSWPAGTQIVPDMLTRVRIDAAEPGITDPRQVLGKQLSRNVEHGAIIRPAELSRPVRSWLAQQVPEGKVLYTLAPQSGSIPHSQLRNGDLFDVIATGPAGVRTVAQDVRLIGVLSARSSAASGAGGTGLMRAAAHHPQRESATSLVVALAPQFVYPLASLGPQDKVSIVLHGTSARQADERPRIEPPPTQRLVEVVTGLERKLIPVKILAGTP
ncbi:hypothetical protein [Marinobacter sp. SS21]|uniref:hypothetical protein n=1 Tax=Marinobacter sp. SS21 TaxID=2979460 RepID=UPI00232E854A|nr:hypothetical protein [Marinobacter sp. SS21]MDC0662275.1 hypothetical protein [Marinobacter sp. SS21]